MTNNKRSLTWATKFREICRQSDNTEEIVSRFWEFIEKEEKEFNKLSNKNECKFKKNLIKQKQEFSKTKKELDIIIKEAMILNLKIKELGNKIQEN